MAGGTGGRRCPPTAGFPPNNYYKCTKAALASPYVIFYNFRQWSLPTNLSGKLALACRAAWSEAGNDLSQIVFFARPASGAVMDGSSGIGEPTL